MKHRPTSPHIAQMRKEVLAEKKRRRTKSTEPTSSRYLIGLAGAALLAAIVFMDSPTDPPTTTSIAQTSP